jgi:oligopeptide/dipeptide ABC transporter ATP-binding protein
VITLTLVDIQGLNTHFYTEEGVVKAVDNVDLKIERGEVLGVVGESGCGKSTIALSVMRLIPYPPGKIVSGRVLFEEQNLLEASDEEIRKIRGKSISMIFQDPIASLNPLFTIGFQIEEAIRAHLNLKDPEVLDRVVELMGKVGISDAKRRIADYPHSFSGGMRQRAMIAMALSCNPRLLIADEATTNLDVTIQAQILDLMLNLRKEFGSSILLITHNMGVVAELADRIAVMYAGWIVELANAVTIFESALHPYTKALLASIPRLDVRQEHISSIPGDVPNLIEPPPGCRFAPRCSFATDKCRQSRPEMEQIGPGHLVACFEQARIG